MLKIFGYLYHVGSTELSSFARTLSLYPHALHYGELLAPTGVNCELDIIFLTLSLSDLLNNDGNWDYGKLAEFFTIDAIPIS
ncbi:hypothetical protein V6N12_044586 [Hibiscus sabdariffa]